VDVAVSPNGTVFIADSGNNRVQYFTSAGSYLGAWGSTGQGPGEFYCLQAITLGPDNSVYVVDSPDEYPPPKEDAIPRIQRFSSSGSFINSWKATFPEVGDLGSFDIAVSADGVIYLPDIFRGRVVLTSGRGEFLETWTPRGTSTDKLDAPLLVAFDPDGDLYIGEYGENRIRGFTPDGDFLCMWGAFGTGPGEFYYLRDIAVGSDGTVFVVDGFNRVQYFDPAGEYLGVFGSPGINGGEFHSPSGIAVGPDGLVFVADTQNHRIQFFRRR